MDNKEEIIVDKLEKLSEDEFNIASFTETKPEGML